MRIIFIHVLDVLHLERDWTVYLLCLVKLFVVFILLPFGESHYKELKRRSFACELVLQSSFIM